MGRSLDDDRLYNRAGGPHLYQNHTIPPHSQHQRMAPNSAAGVKNYNLAPQPSRPPMGGTAGGVFRPETAASPRAGLVGGQYNTPSSNYHPQLQRQDSPYSSLPSHGSGGFAPQPQLRPQMYARDDSSAHYHQAGDVVDKDSPPSSTVGQGPQQPGLQRRAHSQMLSMATSGGSQRYPPPPAQPSRPPTQGVQQPPNSPFYHNLPILPNSAGGDKSHYPGGQRTPVNVTGQPNQQAPRPPHPPDMATIPREYSTPVEESRRRRQSGKPPLEGYVKPMQASSHPIASHNLAVRLPANHHGSRSSPTHTPSHPPTHPPSHPPTHRPTGKPPQHGTVSPSPSTGDISKDINTVIEETASKVRAAENVTEGENSQGIPLIPIWSAQSIRWDFVKGKYRSLGGTSPLLTSGV